MDYNNPLSRASSEQSDIAARPAINGRIDGWSDYDIVFLGYPIWWRKAPKNISTFLESFDFSGKTIIPFCTSHSSGIGSSDTDLQTIASKALWKREKWFNGNQKP